MSFLTLFLTGVANAKDCSQNELFFEVNLSCFNTTLEDAFDEIGDYAKYDNPDEQILPDYMVGNVIHSTDN